MKWKCEVVDNEEVLPLLSSLIVVPILNLIL